MAIAIQQPQRRASALDNLGSIVGVVGGVTGMIQKSQDSAIARAKTKNEEDLQLKNSGYTKDEDGNLVPNEQKQLEIDQKTAEGRRLKALNDASSPESQFEKSAAISSINSLSDSGIMKSPESQQAKKGLLDFIKNPATTGAQIRAQIENSPFLKAEFGLGEARLKGDGMISSANIRNAPQEARNEEIRNQNSIEVGNKYEADPILKLSKTSLNSLQRSQSILDNDKKPVTAKDLNLAYNDYINSVTAGGAATEGKISRELPDTWAQQFNEWQQKYGVTADMRDSPEGRNLISMLKENIKTVRGDIGSAISDQAVSIHNNYLNSTNQQVLEANKRKLQQYAPDKFMELYGGKGKQGQSQDQNGDSPHPIIQTSAGAVTASPDVQAAAKAELIRRQGLKSGIKSGK